MIGVRGINYDCKNHIAIRSDHMSNRAKSEQLTVGTRSGVFDFLRFAQISHNRL